MSNRSGSSAGSQDKPDARIAEHRAQVAMYHAEVGAKRASHGRKINKLELDMLASGLSMSVETDETDAQDQPVSIVVTLTGIADDGTVADFAHFVPPETVRVTFARTPEQVTARIAQDRAIYANERIPDVMRANAEKELSNLLLEAGRRGIAVRAGYVPPETFTGDAKVPPVDETPETPETDDDGGDAPSK